MDVAGGRPPRITVVSAAVVLLVLAATCTAVPYQRASAAAPVSIANLHVVGNQIVNGDGVVVRLLGVNRSGAEYMCIGESSQSPPYAGYDFFDGPSDQASVAAMASWHTNAVRLPLNEDCWLAVNLPGSNPYQGTAYRNAIVSYVNLLISNGLVPILDLEISAPGTHVATDLAAMPDRDHSIAFWSSVASTFKDNHSVIFDVFNEPFPDRNNDTTNAWKCWRDGSQSGVSLNICPSYSSSIINSGYGTYQAAGMQELVNAVRGTGATNIILLGGVTFSGSLSQWLAYKPSDPTGNLGASWHVYNDNACGTSTSCWESALGGTYGAVPVVGLEIGEYDCAHSFIDQLMPFLDARGIGYLGWTWDAGGGWTCAGGPTLITNYSGNPTPFGIGLRDHLAVLATTAPFTSSVSVQPSTVSRGGTATITANVTSQQNATVLVDVEILDPSGTRVSQQYVDNQTFTAGQTRGFPVSWSAPTAATPGTYTVQVGVYMPNWAALYTWNGNAGQFSVASGQVVTSTPTPTSTVPLPGPTATATPGPGATSCSPRPAVGLASVPNGDGRLRVTVTANGAGNDLSSIAFTSDARFAGTGLVDTATQSAQAPPFTIGPLPAGTTSSTFYVRRATAGQPVTLPVTITDRCGPWPTFVGGGPGAF
jgi:hypothetical protein